MNSLSAYSFTITLDACQLICHLRIALPSSNQRTNCGAALKCQWLLLNDSDVYPLAPHTNGPVFLHSFTFNYMIYETLNERNRSIQLSV